MRTLLISFMAYMDLNFFLSTFQTRPNPPFPTTQWNLKCCFVIADSKHRLDLEKLKLLKYALTEALVVVLYAVVAVSHFGFSPTYPV